MRLLNRLRPHAVALIPISISAVLSSWALGTVGWGNTYYSAAVRSMSQSWHAFIYGSFDSAGYVTVDKPPFSMWVQAVVVKIFGFHSMSLLIPQVIAGVATVALVYAVLARRWGRFAAVGGALAMALSPISVMVNHSNNTDAILTLMMTTTVVAGVRAFETRSWRWVVVTGLLFGAAFTSKMLAAAPVLPAVLLSVALLTGISWRRRLALVGGLAAISLASALAWFSFVDLTPKDDRPYVGSSFDNSAYQLAFERNGVNQVEGEQVMTGGPSPEMPVGGMSGDLPPMPPGELPAMPEIPNGGGRSGGILGPMNGIRQLAHGFEGGRPGILRLFNAELGTQIGWLIVPALVSLAVAVAALRRRVLRDPIIVAATTWFTLGAAAYSITEGIVHPYYVASIVPPLAMLFGIGVGIVRDTWDHRFTPQLVGVGVTLSGTVSWVIARRSDWGAASTAAIAVVIAGLLIVATGISARQRSRWLAVAPFIALIVPAVWTAGSLRAGLSANLPYAEPSAIEGFGRPGGGAGQAGMASTDSNVVKFLLANHRDETWIVATASSQDAAPIIIETGQAVMAIGGFSGGDAILTPEDFDRKVANGEVRYVLLGAQGPVDNRGGGGGGGRSNSVTEHVTQVCEPVKEISANVYDCAVTQS